MSGNWLLTCGGDGKADVFDIRFVALGPLGNNSHVLRRTGKEIYSASAAAGNIAEHEFAVNFIALVMHLSGITAAQWHPINELVFATGTKEVPGRLGSSLEQWVCFFHFTLWL